MKELIKTRVATILLENPAARDSDRKLIQEYYWRFHSVDNFSQIVFLGNKLPPFETITRLRRMYQRKGLFMSTEQVACWRREQEVEMRKSC